MRFFDILFVIVPFLIGIGFIFTFAMIFSPKLRSKMMGNQIKSLKYMMEDNKDNLSDIMSNAGSSVINAKKKIMEEHEDSLQDLNTREANTRKDGIEITARAIRDGLVGEKGYCKHCGKLIDKDSKFCKECGKKQ